MRLTFTLTLLLVAGSSGTTAAQSFTVDGCGGREDAYLAVRLPDNTGGCSDIGIGALLHVYNFLYDVEKSNSSRIAHLTSELDAATAKMDASVDAALTKAFAEISKIPAEAATSPSIREALARSVKDELLNDKTFLAQLKAQMAAPPR